MDVVGRVCARREAIIGLEMPFPAASILSAVTPLVLSAFDLSRRRAEAQAAQSGMDEANLPPAAMRARLQELEESDVEQTRLISELSRNVEALARTVHGLAAERRRMRRLVWAFGALAAVSLGLSLWLTLR
jgi:uncharacterized coiled-coil protein SlyX